MPLYMDFHSDMEGITIEDVKNAHTADLAIQAEYGVTFKQFWVNTEAGNVFCLIDGPDKKSCEAVHQAAHGNTACNLSEVESGFYELMMATGGQHGLTMHEDGSPDNAYRNFLAVDIVTASNASDTELEQLNWQDDASKIVLKEIKRHNGRDVDQKIQILIAVFNKIDAAVNCAFAIQRQLNEYANAKFGNRINYKINVSTGQPLVEETDQFFDEALLKAKRLCMTTQQGFISISSLTEKLFKRLSVIKSKTADSLIFLKSKDEDFVSDLFNIVDKELINTTFGVQSLSRDIGISRPQLYRKITALTGKSPNDFIRQLRLWKAFDKLKSKSGNISEIAFQVGFSSPSYFSKCFQDTYGYAPSSMLKQ